MHERYLRQATGARTSHDGVGLQVEQVVVDDPGKADVGVATVHRVERQARRRRRARLVGSERVDGARVLDDGSHWRELGAMRHDVPAVCYFLRFEFSRFSSRSPRRCCQNEPACAQQALVKALSCAASLKLRRRKKKKQHYKKKLSTRNVASCGLTARRKRLRTASVSKAAASK